jgi:ABC-type transport system involved in multi-copper enzyme maturation permease subunit
MVIRIFVMPVTAFLSSNFCRNTWLITRFELFRLFGSPRGWFALAAFAVIWFLILRYPIFEASSALQQADTQAMLSRIFGMIGLYKLMAWPLPELIVYWLISLVLLPLAVMITSADQTSSDRSRGTLRFLALRTSRDSLFLGRFLGQWLVQGLLIVISVVATLGLAIWREHRLSFDALEAALIMSLNLLIVLAPFTALMALCSVLARSARLAICLAIVGGGMLIGTISWAGWYFPDLLTLLQYMPGAQIPALLSHQGWSTFKEVTLPIAQTLVLLVLGRLVLQGKSI